MSDLEEVLDAPGPGGLKNLGGAWDSQIDDALLEAAKAVGEPHLEGLSKNHAWVLLSWGERAASRLTSAPDDRLLDRAILALLLVEVSGALDRRDTLVVASILRRGAEFVGLNFQDGIHRVESMIGGTPFLRGLASVPSSLPPTHEEVTVDDGVEFRRVPSTVDIAELMRRFGK